MRFKFLLIVALLCLVETRRHLKRAVPEPEETKKVLESNHYFSQTQKQTTQKISNLQKGKAVLFILKDISNKNDATLIDNPLTIELISKSEKVTCVFKSYHNMCSLKKVEEDEISLRIECQKTPCEASWRIQQPSTVEKDGSHQIDELVEVNREYDHAMLIVTCSDTNIKDFGANLNIFTNSKYNLVKNQASMYFLFDNQQKGYYFITTDDEATKICANISVRHNTDQLQFNQVNIIQMDYLMPGKTNTFDLATVPETDFKMTGFFHTAQLIPPSGKQAIEVTLYAQKGKQRIKIQTNSISGKNVYSFDFNIVYKKISKEYTKLALDIANKGQNILIINMNFKSDQRQDVMLGETSYFNLKKGQIVNYKIYSQPQQISDDQQTHIFTSDDTKFVPSLTQCKTKAGCEFSVEAREEGQGNIYFGEAEKKNVTQEIVTVFDTSITRKIREGQVIELKKTVKAKQTFQAVINCQNVVIFASVRQKCSQINLTCHQKVLNYHNSFYYEPQKDDELYFKVYGLNNGQFTLTTIDKGTQYIKLEDTKPFTYLLAQTESELMFQFKLQTKVDVNFNLIGPVNELNLLVDNDEKWNQDNRDSSSLSTDGYVSFEKDSIQGLNFVVKVEKREEFMKKAVHFTLLVSTKEGNVRLQPGNSYFQNVKASQTRDYVFQFQPKKQILLNLYTHNTQTPLTLNIKVSTTDNYSNKDDVMSFNLQDQSQVLDLKAVSESLCKAEMAQNCELYVRLENKMQIQLDITLTLMMRNAVIELQDGVWNSFRETEVSRNTHFYFMPKHPNKSVTILYRADFIDLKIMYSIWKSDDIRVTPSEWPFPVLIKATTSTPASPESFVRPTNIVHIDSQTLKQCWPNCIILLTIFEDVNGPKSMYNRFASNDAFKIMASNNFIQIPEKHKVDVILKKDEEKHLLVDLKYVLQKNALTFFTYFTIGSIELSGNVYDEQHPRCPTSDEPGDFKFGNVQTQLSLKTIKKKLQESEMDVDKHPYLCILVKGNQDTKFSIQFDSNDQIITYVRLDTTYLYKGKADAIKLVQMDASQEFRLKITRNQGFPFLTHKMCISGTDLQECLNDFKDSTQKGQQLVDKQLVIKEKPCEKCIMFAKVTTPEPSVISLHCQSRYSETELQEKRTMTDQLEGEQVNKYLITGVKNEELIINIHIFHGTIEVKVEDFDQVSITKNSLDSKEHIGITIPPKNETQSSPIWGSILYSMFYHSTLRTFHMEIKTKVPNTTAMYTVTYSSGQPQSYLQDGLISTFFLMPNKTTKFLYKNPSLNGIYLHLTTLTAQALNKFQFKILSMSNEFDEQSGVDIIPQKVHFNRKTPNPTMMIHLPGNKYFQISIKNTNKHFQLITLGISNQEVIYLPFNHEFPVRVDKNQQLFLVINSPYQSNLELIIKKCGESVLTVGYTFDYQQFSKEQFQHEEEVGQDQLVHVLHLKNKKKGQLYIKLKSSPDEVSLVTVRANFMFGKKKLESGFAGGQGLLTYQMLQSKIARLQFDPIECPLSNKTCSKDFEYSSISSATSEGVYAQLVCPSIAFALEDRQILNWTKSSPIRTSRFGSSKISFTETMKTNIDFVGVKAQNKKTGQVIYYKPVQLTTFWGQMQKHSNSNNDLIGISVILMLICCIMICLRRRSNSLKYQYTPLQSTE